MYICMIFHEKIFQCVAGAIPLFLTPQKIGLLRILHLAFQADRIMWVFFYHALFF